VQGFSTEVRRTLGATGGFGREYGENPQKDADFSSMISKTRPPNSFVHGHSSWQVLVLLPSEVSQLGQEGIGGHCSIIYHLSVRAIVFRDDCSEKQATQSLGGDVCAWPPQTESLELRSWRRVSRARVSH